MKDSRRLVTLCSFLLPLLGWIATGWAQQVTPTVPYSEAQPEVVPSTDGLPPTASPSPVPHSRQTISPAHSQDASAIASTEQHRDRLYSQLADEVRGLETQGRIMRKVVKLVRPAVVHIEADKLTEPISSEHEPEGISTFIEEAGSGVIVQINDGFYVLTNRHVIRGAKLSGIRVQLSDRRVIHPSKVWSDDATDVALLEIVADNLAAIRISTRPVEIGDFVLAFGSPFGLNHSVTHGIISAKGRRDLRLGDTPVDIQDFLQTDAAINPGNSGGPLLNLRGELIGINTAIASNSGGNEGIAFAIPIDMAMVVAKRLVMDGGLHRAYLGVQLASDFDYCALLPQGMGIGTQVTKVSKGSPAHDAQIEPGDVIVRFGEIPVEDDSHLVSLVALAESGVDIPVTLYRDGKEMVVLVSVRSKDQAVTSSSSSLAR